MFLLAASNSFLLTLFILNKYVLKKHFEIMVNLFNWDSVFQTNSNVLLSKP